MISFIFFILMVIFQTICVVQGQLDPNFDDGGLSVLEIDEKFKNETFFHDLMYLNSNFSIKDAFHTKFPLRDRTGSSSNKTSCQQIRSIPSNIRSDLKLTYFYQKYTEAYGIPVIGSNKASTNGLKRACYVLKFYLANNVELREHFYKKNLRVVVMAVSENLLNLPEYNSFPAHFNALRGLSPTSLISQATVGEENVQCSINDKQKNEDLLFHQLSYALVSMNSLDSKQKSLLEASFNKAKSQFKGSQSFSLTDPKEYLAKAIDVYSGANTKKDNSIDIIEDVKSIDPLILSLIQQIFICNNVYINKCKSSRETQVLKLGKNCEPEVQTSSSSFQETPTTSKSSVINSEQQVEEPITRQKSIISSQSNIFKQTSTGMTISNTEATVKKTKSSESPQDKMIDCFDFNENCVIWTTKGECTRNRQFMMIECKKSCDFCKESKATLKIKTTTQMDLSIYESFCKDEFAHCPVFALRGDCKTNPHHMLEKCKRSCNLCGDLVDQKDRIQLTSKKSSIRRPVSDTPFQEKTSKSFQTKNTSMLYTTITAKAYSTSISTSSTTSKMSNKNSKPCVDLAEHCPDLAARGDCASNKDTMLYYCPFSCKFC